MVTSDSQIYANISRKPINIQFAIIHDKENEQILSSEILNQKLFTILLQLLNNFLLTA